MAVVIIKTGTISIENKVDNGFDENSRIAEAIYEIVQMIDSRNGAKHTLRDLLLLRLKHGSSLGGKKK